MNYCTDISPFLLLFPLIGNMLTGGILFQSQAPEGLSIDSNHIISIALDDYFSPDPNAASTSDFGHYIRFETILGPMNIRLSDDPDSAGTVSNFLQHLDDGYYDDSIFHRRVDGVIQGGSYRAAPPSSGSVLDSIPPAGAPSATTISTEYGKPNQRGTIAMVPRFNQDTGRAIPDSATTSWAFNVWDNSDRFAPGGPVADQGLAVFGEIVDPESLAVLDALYAIPVYSIFDNNKNRLFDNWPLTEENESLDADSLVWIHSVSRSLQYQIDGQTSWLWSEDGNALYRIENNRLIIHCLPGWSGDGNVLVTALTGTGITRTESIPYRADPSATGYVSLSLAADQVSGIWWSRWLGYYWADLWPHLYIYQVGWFYVLPALPESYWMYDYSHNQWIWTSPTYYPIGYAFHPSHQGWIHIITQSPIY